MDYVVDGRLLGGFGVLAYPAEYGNSGIMTFIVNHDGILYQKDLGSETEQTARSINAFDPGEGWTELQHADPRVDNHPGARRIHGGGHAREHQARRRRAANRTCDLAGPP